ncbi:MAG: hypothetical protein R6U78_06885 [Bacteroidales bacterium]
MKVLKFLRDFALMFVLVFVVASIVTYVFNLISEGAGTVDWETSFRLAVILGISLPVAKIFDKPRPNGRH